MAGDTGREEPPEIQTVLDALDDPDCRTIIRTLDEPMTAAQISDTCDIPMSTVYRKLEQLSEASLLDERTRIRTDGHHAATYTVGFERVTIDLDEGRRLDISIDRRSTSPEERIATMWEEVRNE